MKETFDKIFSWVKNNVLLSVGIATVITMLFFPKLLRPARRYVRRRRIATRGISLRRRRTRRQYSRGGKAKKPWQIKGSLAARRHMARIRRMR